jgi:hypothetical protein
LILLSILEKGSAIPIQTPHNNPRETQNSQRGILKGSICIPAKCKQRNRKRNKPNNRRRDADGSQRRHCWDDDAAVFNTVPKGTLKTRYSQVQM